MRKLAIVGFLAALLSAPVTTGAAERRAVPELVLTDLAGGALASPGLPDSGTWLLVYVKPACVACDTLLEQMNQDERPEARRIVIVVGGGAADAQAIQARYKNLADAVWRLDVGAAAAKAIPVRAAPAVAGVRGRTIEWDLAGILRGGDELESVLFSWLRGK
jgi:hypothetical protein